MPINTWELYTVFSSTVLLSGIPTYIYEHEKPATPQGDAL